MARPPKPWRPCVAPLPPERRAASPLRVALVGIGSAATRAHLPALSGFAATGAVTVVGVCDRDAGRRGRVTAAHPGAAGFVDNDEMLDATSPDLLVIATPPSAHLGEVAAAATRGVHVLCEKPLGLADADVAALHELAGGHPGLALVTVHQYSHAQPWRWVARAAAGAVRAGEAFAVEVVVDRSGTDPLSSGGWRADAEHEGGILGDHGAHYLSLLRLLDPRCEVVACRRGRRGGRETASVRLRLGAGGSAVVDLSYAAPRRRNLIRLSRPAQCLEVVWEDGLLRVAHDGRWSPPRAVASLSDRAVVNALYVPMYEQLLEGLCEPSWGARATTQTVAGAQLLATAIRLAAAGSDARAERC